MDLPPNTLELYRTTLPSFHQGWYSPSPSASGGEHQRQNQFCSGFYSPRSASDFRQSRGYPTPCAFGGGGCLGKLLEERCGDSRRMDVDVDPIPIAVEVETPTNSTISVSGSGCSPITHEHSYASTRSGKITTPPSPHQHQKKEHYDYEEAALQFGVHRLSVGALSICINIYKGKICIHMRKFSRLGGLLETVTINGDEFMWLIQGGVDSPSEGRFNRIESSPTKPLGFWKISRTDGDGALERSLVLSPYTYQKLLEKKDLIREKVVLAEETLGGRHDETTELYQEMVVLLARERYKVKIFTENREWDVEEKSRQARSCLHSVKIGLVKGIFATCNGPIINARSISEVIGVEEKTMVENVIAGCVNVRAITMYSDFLEFVKPASSFQ